MTPAEGVIRADLDSAQHFQMRHYAPAERRQRVPAFEHDTIRPCA